MRLFISNLVGSLVIRIDQVSLLVKLKNSFFFQRGTTFLMFFIAKEFILSISNLFLSSCLEMLKIKIGDDDFCVFYDDTNVEILKFSNIYNLKSLFLHFLPSLADC